MAVGVGRVNFFKTQRPIAFLVVLAKPYWMSQVSTRSVKSPLIAVRLKIWKFTNLLSVRFYLVTLGLDISTTIWYIPKNIKGHINL